MFQKFISDYIACNIMAMLTIYHLHDTKLIETGKSKIFSYVFLNEIIKCVSGLTSQSMEPTPSFHMGALKFREFFDMQMFSEQYGINRLPNASKIDWRI